MAIHKILKMGNPLLNQIAKTVVDPKSPKIAELVTDIRDSLDAVGGNGLAAPQIGVSLRVVVYRMPKTIIPKGSRQVPVTWTYMINPTIIKFSAAKKPIWERCLSIPGLYGQVPRHTEVEFCYTTLSGDEVHDTAYGFHAMTLQHECDHLDGVLYPMRMEDLSMLRFLSEVNSNEGFYTYTIEEFD